MGLFEEAARGLGGAAGARPRGRGLEDGGRIEAGEYGPAAALVRGISVQHRRSSPYWSKDSGTMHLRAPAAPDDVAALDAQLAVRDGPVDLELIYYQFDVRLVDLHGGERAFPLQVRLGRGVVRGRERGQRLARARAVDALVFHEIRHLLEARLRGLGVGHFLSCFGLLAGGRTERAAIVLSKSKVRCSPVF